MKEKNKNVKKRTFILKIVLSVAFVSLLGVLFKVQIIDRDEYTAKNNIVKSQEVDVEAARGDIVDRNGNPLVTNKQYNSLIFDAAVFPEAKQQKKRNEIISSLIKLFKTNGQEYIDELPIKLNDKNEFEFIEDKDEEIKYLKSKEMLNLNDYATAKNCMDELVKRYELEEYSKLEQRDISSVLVQMKKEYFCTAYPYTFAKKVPTNLVAKVMENNDFYKGVDSTVEAERIYTDGTLAPHILGRISSISPETYKEKSEEYKDELLKLKKEKAPKKEIDALNRNKYTRVDKFGEFGIEKVAEEYLRGTKGVDTVTIDTEGNKNTLFSVEPKQGDTVVLTIDKNMQKVAEDSLKKKVTSLSAETGKPCAAAVVALDVHSGEVLACATYPSYDISTYKDNYKDLATDPNAPLWNRALKSTYAPGSTFKPLVAVAALENGTITKDKTFTCNRYFPYCGHTFICQGHHGTINVVEAINKSCNIFFYNTGRDLGIEKIDQYASMFGLGQATGVELPEATGVVASVENKESMGQPWRPGDTVQAAIGQSDHLFTPIQLANYVNTIANGGTRYVPHFVKSIKSYDYSDTVMEKEKQVAVETKVSQKNLDIVKEGMYKVGTVGFCRRIFADLPVEAAAKTGTSTLKKKVDGKIVQGTNGFLISYAPYENPEIALAIVVETADTGSSTASIARDIYDYYFTNKGVQQAQVSNQLLS